VSCSPRRPAAPPARCRGTQLTAPLWRVSVQLPGQHGAREAGRVRAQQVGPARPHPPRPALRYHLACFACFATTTSTSMRQRELLVVTTNCSELLGSCAAVWRLVPVPGDDSFHIVAESRAEGCLRYLGGPVHCADRSVQLYAADDSTGQQRVRPTRVRIFLSAACTPAPAALGAPTKLHALGPGD
jgi:hypothetical protein